jgi:cell division protein FtsN
MLSTILPQAASGNTIIIDAKNNATGSLPAQPEIVAQQPAPQALVDDSAFGFQIPESQAAPLPAPVIEATLPETRISPAPSNLSFEAFAAPVDTPPVQTQEHFAEQFSPAEESRHDFTFQTEDKITEAEIQEAKTSTDFYAQPQEISSQNFSDASFLKPPQEFAPSLMQLEKEPQRQTANDNFFVVQEDDKPVVQDLAATFVQDFAEPATPHHLNGQDAPPVYSPNSAPLYEAQQSAPLYPQPSAYQAAPVAEDSPHSWDAASTHYPVLMVQEEKSGRSKPLLALAAVALIALLAVGSFFAYKQFFSPASTKPTQRADAKVEGNTPPPPAKSEKAAQASAPVQEPPAAAAANPASAQTTPADKVASDVKPATDAPPAGQGKVSLQAASFPNQQAAKEFSEKLIRAGITSYVASANIAGKGTWYRVRVGRFASAEEAERFAEQAKQRAKAAGIAIQLVRCDYDNP